MASWRDSLGRVRFNDGRVLIGATFRGVPFYVETVERSGGRRTVRHDFPLRDEPFVEDMGRAARSFPIEGYVVGAGYVAERDALITALEAAGPGELIHPTYGTRRVICPIFRVRESTADGGMARFALEFEETQAAAPAPVATVAAAAMVDADGTAITAAMRATLAVRAAVSLPGSALASISSAISTAAAALEVALSPIVAGTQELANLKRAVDGILLDADALAREPGDVLDDFEAALVAFRTPTVPPTGGAVAMLAAYLFEPTVARPPATTATRIEEQEVYDLTLATVRTLLVVEAARLAVGEAFDTYDAAVVVRDAICEALDTQAETADDDTFAALEQLRADLVRALPGEGTDLPRLVAHVPAFTVPSLVLAHRLYGDVSLEADLVTRNGVRRPGFVPGGEALEVLSHGR